MSTRAVVAVPYAGSWRGRYVHWSGAPEYLRPTLYALVVRDGLDHAAEVLTERHYGWSEVTGDAEVTLREGQAESGRFVAVPGYGIAYTEENDVSAEDWLTPDNLAAAWVEWVYVLTPDGIATYAVSPDGEPTPYTEAVR